MADQTSMGAVLLVDDEPLIVDIMQGAVEEAGFPVLAAIDDDEAFAIIEADQARNLVGLVTDVNLRRPRKGWDIAKRARELNPSLAVIYTSGDSAHDWTHLGVPASVMLMKPFAPAQLVVALASLINAAGPEARD